MNHKIVSVDSAYLLRKSFEIIQFVFVNEQGVSEGIVHDDPNKSFHYFVAIDAEDNALGTAR